jgi:peptide methionine sulfoxide reductase msrA/msrB
MTRNKLTEEEEHIIRDKGTERAGTGELLNEKREGIFICRRCNAPLYNSGSKFDSGCGRPSFDQAIPGAVDWTTDKDGHRTEITCHNCEGHLGHVFVGERMTEQNTRHCVNSLSMRFVAQEKEKEFFEANPIAQDLHAPRETIYFWGGCFWCIEAVFQQFLGVIEVKSGYMGGKREYPSYEQVSTGVSGHIEVVQVTYNPQIIPLDILLDGFFISHDPTSMDKQGGDSGEQYRSVIFYTTPEQKKTIDTKVTQLNKDTYEEAIVTHIKAAENFWIAEGYHQDFYNQNSSKPYCQIVIDPKIKKIRESLKEWIK